jgi:subtilase family serine protease
MSKARFDRKKRAISAAVIEPLELRRMLSASLPDPVAQPLYAASPASGTLADGSTTPPSSAFTPAQIRAAYGISSIKLNGVVGDGTGQTIAIVTAFDNPALVSSTSASFASSDLHIFDRQFGLPDPPSFTKIEQVSGGSNPSPDVSWAEESALDVEWTHAIAPAAKIVLVEAHSAGALQLLDYGVATAADYPGVSVVSTSWGFGEFSGETSYDSFFTTPVGHGGVTFVASTGDTGAPGIYPAFSRNVVAVGGTHLSLSGSTYSSETGYASSGGGASAYESKPSYQSGVTQSASERTIPDVAFDGDPNTGVDVYDSYNGGFPGWYKIAGTSFSAPAWAGLIAIANQGRAGAKLAPLDGATQTLPKLYSIPSGDFHDITSGNNGFSAGTGYDLVTGRGTPIANLLLPALAGVPAGSTTVTGSIAGTSFFDANRNGTFDSGDTGFSARIYMDINHNGVLDSGEPSYPTSSAGTYKFNGIPAGTYQLREVVPSGYRLTNPTSGYLSVTVTSGAAVTGINFGNARIIGSISGYVYVDANSNGKLDTGEKPLAGVTLFIDTNHDGKLDNGEVSTKTNSSGYYYFGVSTTGTFRIVEILPTGYHLTNPKVGYYGILVNSGWNIKNENWGNLL